MEGLCLVLMPIKKRLEDVFEGGIKPAIENLGLSCLRVDQIARPGNILADIITHIFKADVIIADLTGQNANVFYELGISHALADNSILIAQSLKDVPFDLRPYRVITYKVGAEGLAKLGHDLAKTITEMRKGEVPPTNPVHEFLPEASWLKEMFTQKELLYPPPDSERVTFTCASPEAENAEEVYVVAEFNDWLRAEEGLVRPYPWDKERYGLEKVVATQGRVHWKKDIWVPRGHHDFKFVVGRRHWIHWYEGCGYPRGNDAPGGPNLRVEV